MFKQATFAMLAAGGLIAACSASESADGLGFGGSSSGDGLGAATGGSLGLPSGELGGAGGVPLPEEVEALATYLAPVATGEFLWTANPASGRVALINVKTLAVEVYPAGLTPTYLARVPRADGSPSVIVQNIGSSNASWFRKAGSGVVQVKIPTQAQVNQLSVSPNGRFVLFWSLADEDVEVTEGLQDLVIADLSVDPPKTTRLTVGYRPRDVRINGSEDRAVVVGESDVTLIDLGDAPVTSGYLPLGEGAGRDVSFDADLKYALVRRANDSEVEVKDLNDSSKDFSIPFDAPVTDLDLLGNGLGVAVLRAKSQMITFRLEDIIVDPSAYDVLTIAGETFGSAEISPSGNCAVLYTNAADVTNVQVVNLGAGADYLKVRTLDTTAGVYRVDIGPDGKHAVATSGSGSGPTASFSVLNLTEARFPRVVGTSGKIKETIVGNDVVLVTAGSGEQGETTLVSLPGLSLTRLPLASAPLRSGLLPEQKMAYVAQSHSEGRLTFYGLTNLGTGKVAVQTVTGFELSADVVNR